MATNRMNARHRHVDDSSACAMNSRHTPIKVVVYVWFNDEDTLRKARAKSDVYEVFRRMLIRGQAPSSMTELLADSSA